MKKVISFSLYGTVPKYCVGAVKNLELAVKLFPEFHCFFYVDSTVPVEVLNELKSHSRCKLISIGDNFIPLRMQRFLAIDEPDVSIFLSRDVDSRLSERERFVIDDWLNRSEHFISIKDNPYYHNTHKMLAGMWGMKKSDKYGIKDKIQVWMRESGIKDSEDVTLDQQFLSDVIYPEAKNDLAYYDNFNLNREPFASNIKYRRNGYRFIGEVFDENDNPDFHWKAIRDHEIRSIPLLGGLMSRVIQKLNI